MSEEQYLYLLNHKERLLGLLETAHELLADLYKERLSETRTIDLSRIKSQIDTIKEVITDLETDLEKVEDKIAKSSS
jgi:hypothetical protein